MKKIKEHIIIYYYNYEYKKCECYNIFKIFDCDCKNFFKINFIFYIIILYVMLFTLIALYLIILAAKTFNDGIYKNLRENWKMNPIKEINILETKIKPKEAQEILGIFEGIENPKKYKNTTITNWRTKNFEFEFYKDYSYKNLLKKSYNNKICGKDSENNPLYFPINIECPINFIEISNETKSSIDGKYEYKKLNLSDDLFLYYSNEYIDGEILVELKVSSKEGMCFDLNYDNDFAPYILNYNIKDKKRGCINNLYDERLKIIDEDSIDNFLKNNNIEKDIKFNETYYNFTKSKIYLYKRGYIGLNESFKTYEINKVINAPKFSKIKNAICFVYTLFYIIFFFIPIAFEKKLTKNFITIDISFILIYSVPVMILNYIEIYNYKIIKKILKSISSTLFFKYENGYIWYIKIDFYILYILFFFLILRFLLIFCNSINNCCCCSNCCYYCCSFSCKFKRKKEFNVPREIIKKLYKHRIKLLEDKKHKNNFIEKKNLKKFKKILKNLYSNDIKIKLDNLRNFNDNNDRNIKKYLDLINNYKF